MFEACYVDFCLVPDTHLQSSCPWWAAFRAQELFWEVPFVRSLLHVRQH